MRERSLQARVLLTVLFSVLFMVVVSVGIGLSYFQQSMEEGVQKKARVLTDLQAQALISPLWSLDDDLIRKMLKDLEGDEDFAYVEIINTPDQSTYSYGTPVENTDRVVTASADIAHTENGETFALGTLKLSLSLTRGEEVFQTLVMAIGGLTALVLLVIFGGIYGAFRQLTVPLGRITTCMNALVQGKLDVEVPERQRNDEIGRMADSLQVFKEKAQEVLELERREAENAERTEREKRESQDRIVGDFEQSISSIVEMVSASALALNQFAQDMTVTAENSSQLSAISASASEEASANISSISASTDELSTSTDTILQGLNRVIPTIEGMLVEAEEAAGNGNALAEQQVERLKDILDLARAHAGVMKDHYEATREISRNVAMMSDAAAEVSESIFSVKAVAKEAGDSAMQINVAAADLNIQADILQVEASAFVEHIRKS